MGSVSATAAGAVATTRLGLSWSVEADTPLGRALHSSDGIFAPATTRFLLANVRPGMCVLDVGAHVGWFTLLLARAVGPQGRVLAFEPVAAHRRALHWHLVQNNLHERVRVLPFGLSDRDGERPIAIGKGTASLHWPGGEVPVGSEVVTLRRLDDLRAELGIDRLDLVHLDLAGHEPRVLRGASGTLRALRPVLSLAFDQSALHHDGSDARAQLAALHDLDYELADEATGVPFASDLDALRVCGNFDRPGRAVARPVEQIADLPVRLHRDLPSLQRELRLATVGAIFEDDIDRAENDCELHGRKRRDAEVLCTVARNRRGPCLDLGTSFGRSAFKLATNVGPEHTVFTVNMLPEQAAAAGVHITHVLTREQIGSYCRERGVDNVEQVFADTANWQPDPRIANLAVAFVDACHDAEAVRRDSHLCWQRLRRGGVLLWHDFAPIQRHRHDWIRTSMQGVAMFLRDIGHLGPVHHLRGSWIGLIEKATR